MTPRFVVRPATPLDAAAIARLLRAVFDDLPGEHTEDLPENLVELLEDAVADPGPSSYWVATLGDDVVGTSRASALGPGEERLLSLDWICVDEGHRSEGIGSKLLKATIGDAPAMSGTPDDGVASFFANHNFTPDGTDYGVPCGRKLYRVLR